MNYAECKESAKILRDVLCASPLGRGILDKQIMYQGMNEVDKHLYNPAPVIEILSAADYANLALIYTERAFGQPWHFSSEEALNYNYQKYVESLIHEINRIPMLTLIEMLYLVNVINALKFPYYLTALMVEEAGLHHYHMLELARMN